MSLVRLDPADRAMLANLSKKLCKIDKNTDGLEALVEAFVSATVRTPGYHYIGPGNVGAVAPGFKSFAIANIGNSDALVDGKIFPSGLSIPWPADGANDTILGISYDTQATILAISTVL